MKEKGYRSWDRLRVLLRSESISLHQRKKSAQTDQNNRKLNWKLSNPAVIMDFTKFDQDSCNEVTLVLPSSVYLLLQVTFFHDSKVATTIPLIVPAHHILLRSRDYLYTRICSIRSDTLFDYISLDFMSVSEPIIVLRVWSAMITLC